MELVLLHKYISMNTVLQDLYVEFQWSRIFSKGFYGKFQANEKSKFQLGITKINNFVKEL